MFRQNVFSKHSKKEWVPTRLTEVEFWTKRLAKNTVLYSHPKYHQSIFVDKCKFDFTFVSFRQECLSESSERDLSQNGVACQST